MGWTRKGGGKRRADFVYENHKHEHTTLARRDLFFQSQTQRLEKDTDSNPPVAFLFDVIKYKEASSHPLFRRE